MTSACSTLRTAAQFVVGCLGFAAAFLMAGGPARAEQDFGFSLNICESQAVLNKPNNQKLRVTEAMVPQDQIALARSRPFIDIKNTSKDAFMTTFRMTIGDLTKKFSSLRKISVEGVGIKSHFEENGNVLVLRFTDFDPGEKIRLQIHLAPDSPNAFKYPDYRETLFDINGNGKDENSIVTAAFGTNYAETRYAAGAEMPDWHVTGPVWTAPCAHSYYKKDKINPFCLDAGGNLVPEPSSIALGILGGLCAVGMAVRTRRRS